MVARNRTATFQRQGGVGYFNNDPGNPFRGPGTFVSPDYSYCGDITGPGDCAPFSVDRRTTSGGYLNKDNGHPFSTTFIDYIVDAMCNTNEFPHLFVPGIPSDVELATTAAARSNPSRPYVDVPVNILDIKTRARQVGEDLSNIFRRFPRRMRVPPPSGREILRESGSGYLQYQFLIRPLVGDIVKMAHVLPQISRRIEQINDLFDGDGMRKTIDLGQYTASEDYFSTLQSLGTYVSTTIHATTTVSCRVHCRWAPTERCGVPPPPSTINAWARRAVNGYTIDASTLWEITPWSWLIDWFGNVGEYLKAQRNIIPAQLIGVHPMRHTITHSTFDSQDFSDGSLSSGEIFRESKQRVTSFVAPVAHFPFLDGGQMGILGALAAARI